MSIVGSGTALTAVPSVTLTADEVQSRRPLMRKAMPLLTNSVKNQLEEA
jgi:hypothetical protein